LPTLPTYVLVSVEDVSPNPDLICILYEKIKIYDTIRVENNTVNFFNLSGGNYELTFINLKNNNRAKVSFSIEPVFWEKWWFSPFVFLVISVVLGVIFYFLSLIRLRQQLRLQSVRHELEIKALRAQMNPHFIFNCMNTIDAYILRKKFLEASDYLQKFSKLIRKILENSESQTISIAQEIQTLKLYIELEQERFAHSFVSYFDVEPELIANDYQIPSLVLQPFVENAILHGIRHLTERKGLISIILKKIKNESGEDILFCQIQDNGVGRKASSVINEQRQASHKSMGVNVTLERINTYQAIYGSKMETVVSDLEEGTKVEIKLPLFIGDL
jgi:LytS/YehU family sensor histidine kinase